MLWHACAAPCGIRGFSRPPMSPGSRQKRRRRSSIRWQEPPDLRRWELPVQQEVRKSTPAETHKCTALGLIYLLSRRADQAALRPSKSTYETQSLEEIRS